MISENKAHWEEVFQTKDSSKVSWYQNKPQRSLDLIIKYAKTKSAYIIDVGAGDSRVPDFLLAEGYQNLSILDLSKFALEASKDRLDQKAKDADWILGDVLDFNPTKKYDVWHDRAVFHFLVTHEDQRSYKKKLLSSLSENAHVIIAAFSKNGGAEKCSGLRVSQHNRGSILGIFKPEFEMVDDFEATHITPSGSEQNFYWSMLKKL